MSDIYIDAYVLLYNKINAKPLMQFSPPLQPEEAIIFLKKYIKLNVFT
jgi:hypothetical protein